MSSALNQPSDDSGEDSDIQEVVVIPPPSSETATATTSRNKHNTPFRSASPIMKRRKSSPQMDPIPSYTPTPLHILEQRARGASSGAYDDHYPTAQVPIYEPGPIFDHDASSRHSSRGSTHHDDYTPLLRPSPHVIGCLSSERPPKDRPASRCETLLSDSSRVTTGSLRKVSPSSSSSTPRPVSSALAQAVSRRRNSLAQQERKQQEKTTATIVSCDDASLESTTTPQPSSVEYAQQPVMWSPKVPSEIKKQEEEPAALEDYSKYQSARPQKQRIAHKPTVPKNNRNRPRVPQGTSRTITLPVRVKYLDIIINEYLNTGHPEEESYKEALKEEKALAERASSKSIYVSLVAGFKKKLREKAGILTQPQKEDPKFVNGNKVMSHEEILTGRVRGTFSIERKRKLSDPAELNEEELYERLSRYIMPKDQLTPYGYPYRDPENPELRMAPLGKDGQKQTLRVELASSYACERCAKIYRLGEDGMQLPSAGKCIFHPGHLWNERINRALEKRYSCCKGDPSAGGCCSNAYHVHRGELELENYRGYVETRPKTGRDPNKHGIYALDCEMCYTTYGLELTRVTVINYKNEVVYEKLVKPTNPILDYNTKFSGIKPGDLDHVRTTLADVQRDLLRMFSDKTILVGHSLDSDMRALKIFHERFIDTAQLFPHKRGLPYKRALRTLMVENLQVIIQEDAGHDSKEDACAALRLVMWKAKTDIPTKA